VESAGDAEIDRRRVTLDDLEVLIDRAVSARLDVRMTTTGSREGLSPAVELTVYRIVQEALTNVFRHVGPGASVQLRLGYSPTGVSVLVDDSGPGAFSPVKAARSSGGHGLIGMRERVSVHGGSFAAGPATGGGWRVQAFVPASTSREPVPAAPEAALAS
jgi:signal transduction histidine kinase